MEPDLKALQLDEWVFKARLPAGEGPHPLTLLLHGWTGDENVMWIFTDRLPENHILVAVRGLHPTPLGGYGWHPHRSEGWPTVDEFRPAAEALLALLPDLARELYQPQPQGGDIAAAPGPKPEGEEPDFTSINLVGFSQGAALAYTFALLYPDRVQGVAGLAGFLPRQAEELVARRPLQGKHFFAAHGTEDQMVDVKRARRAVEALEQAGARVTYCEDNVGHKLSLNCFRGLENYFKSF